MSAVGVYAGQLAHPASQPEKRYRERRRATPEVIGAIPAEARLRTPPSTRSRLLPAETASTEVHR